MTKSITLLLGLLLSVQALALDASLSYATFKNGDQRYIEVYLHVAGKSVATVAVNDSMQQAGVDVLVLFQQGDKVVKYDKYVLNGPVARRSLDFVDLRRYSLSDGLYKVVVKITDINRPDNTKEYATDLQLDYSGDTLRQSDLQLLAAVYRESNTASPFVKNGFYLEPLPYNFYGRNASTLAFYNEIYNADKAIADDFVVSYFIEKDNNGKAETVLIGHKRQTATPVVPLLIQMDISTLESGNYTLVVEVRNRLKALLSKKTLFFQRSNPFLNQEKIDLTEVNLNEEFVGKLSPDELEYSLRALTPLLPQPDVEVVNLMLKNDSINAQRMYLISYWLQRSPTAPQTAYEKYMEVARAVDKQFNSGFRHGFETDRGYVYLKYGQPNDMERRENENSAPPYEIWSYNEIKRTKQNNVRFVFYNPSLAPEDFVLLHSDVIGEISNPQWMRDLYRDAPNEIDGSNYFDGTGVQDNFNRNAGRVIKDN